MSEPVGGGMESRMMHRYLGIHLSIVFIMPDFTSLVKF